jgi:6-phosphogluconolactonase
MSGDTKQNLVVVPDRAALSQQAAERFTAASELAIGQHGAFTVALSGGSTPRDLFRLLTEAPWRDGVDWSRTQIFWGDERCVPPDHAESNYRLARETLLDQVPLPAANVHRMRAELADRSAAAAEYEAELARLLPRDPADRPSFDLMLLGLGADSHTASLLPGSKLLHERQRLVAVTDVEREGTIRLTVTAPVLQHAARLLFLISGSDKASALTAVISGALDLERHPAQLVRQAQGEVVWLVDAPAAAELDEVGQA